MAELTDSMKKTIDLAHEAAFSDSAPFSGSVSAETLRRLEKFYHWTQLMPKTLLADRVKLGEMVKFCMEPLKEKKQNKVITTKRT